MKKTIDLAIIIPTLNEEHYIGKLLDSIIEQTVQPKEIVVVDAQSPDNTVAEIKIRMKHLPQLKYYQIPKDTISKQRNLGINKTNAEHVLFLDADMQLLEKDTLEQYFEEVIQKKPDLASALNMPDTHYWKDKLFFRGMDVAFKALKPFWPMAQGMNMYMSRKSYHHFGGFDEAIKIGEDHELVQRIIKRKGKFIYLKKPQLFTSVRRIRKVGRVKFALLMIVSLGLVIFVGYKKNPLSKKYEMGNHEGE
jgi:glycosyltransferase involved in cell wall biosynthesis